MHGKPLKMVEAGGGVLFRRNSQPSVLLIYRNNVWDLPKGHREPGESLENCAVREVSEELGIELPVNLGFIGQTEHEYKLDGVTIRKKTSWYAMTTTAVRFTPQIEENITNVRWFALNEAKKKVAYENLQKILSDFETWLNKSENG